MHLRRIKRVFHVSYDEAPGFKVLNFASHGLYNLIVIVKKELALVKIVHLELQPVSVIFRVVDVEYVGAFQIEISRVASLVTTGSFVAKGVVQTVLVESDRLITFALESCDFSYLLSDSSCQSGPYTSCRITLIKV